MPRFCLVESNSTNHCTWRAHDREHVFEEPGARERFLELLGEHKGKHAVRIHSYCLMGTHPHVVCTFDLGQEAFSKFWQVVNYRFARWYNRRRKRRGTRCGRKLPYGRICCAPQCATGMTGAPVDSASLAAPVLATIGH